MLTTINKRKHSKDLALAKKQETIDKLGDTLKKLAHEIPKYLVSQNIMKHCIIYPVFNPISRGARRPPLIGQQGGRRLNTRLSLADHFEYLNLKNDHVAIICNQTYFGDLIPVCCPLKHIKISALGDPGHGSYATFSNFQKVELTKLPPKVNFNVLLSKLYLCAPSRNRHHCFKN